MPPQRQSGCGLLLAKFSEHFLRQRRRLRHLTSD